MNALHRFFCDRPTVAARCKRCGKQVAVYWAHTPDCPACTVADDGGWRDWGRCRCRPVLPNGSTLADKIAEAHATRGAFWHRASQTIRV
ncbi:hypothetical protein HZU40_21065 [Mycolicibacterium fluoranthenivorans]|uniref:Uncharacterized protein n=1 Tax=Mycolicibacterium fluoranthenivorans TaxID=258505 RepID=A0A7G8P8R7_9MYCO|nr:hypothetical protein HZU40_21065 [Mycolicibacterium fluoranthenivorans]